MANMQAVFGSTIDVLGIIIYGTELTLWMGIFICGGVFNLRPWIKERAEQRDGNLQDPVSLHPMPSSTSVFRTASGSEVMGRRPWQSSWRISYSWFNNLISNYDYLFIHQTVMFLLLMLSSPPPLFDVVPSGSTSTNRYSFVELEIWDKV